MKLAVSNIGWNIQHEKKYLTILKKNKISNLEVVPLKLFKSWKNVKKENIIKLKKYYAKNNLKIISIQGIFYQKKFSFYKKNDLEKIILHLKKIILICRYLDCKHIVFGSPDMRRGKKDKFQIALGNFALVIKKINNLLEKNQIYLSIEPVSKIYNCDLLNNISETINFCKQLYLA